MITDIVLDVNIVADICAKREPYAWASSAAFGRAFENGHRVWLSVASVQSLEYVIAAELRRGFAEQSRKVTSQEIHTLAKRQVEVFSSKTQWLAALAGDGMVFDQPDPGDAQLIRAVERLGKDARLLTRDESLLAHCPQAISPKEYLEQPDKFRSIAFNDISAQQDLIRPQLEHNIHTVLRHGQYIMGPEVRELETDLAKFTGVKHAVTCSSGTDALLLGLMAYDVGPGDAVFTTAFTFIATAEVISLLGATPVFVDIDEKTFNIDPFRLEEAVQKIKQEGKLTPRGVIPVDLFGLPADYDAINILSEKYSLFVLEDAAQGFGGVYKGKRAGTLGHVAAISFFPAKPLGCYGDGGALFTNDDTLAEIFNSLRFHGKGHEKYDNVRIGVNARLDTLQAAILRPKLAVFADELLARQRISKRYSTKLDGMVETPYIPEGLVSAWAQYSILLDERNNLQAELHKANIPSGVYYPKPLHMQTAFNNLGYQQGDFPRAERAARRILSLPIHPYLRNQEMDQVIDVIQKMGLTTGNHP